MTSLIHSSITEPNDRKNSLNSTDTSRSFLPNDSSFSSSRFKRKKPSAIIDQILHADKSGATVKQRKIKIKILSFRIFAI